MRKFSLIILLIASLSSTLFAQDCANPLLGFLGLQGLDDPISGVDLPYCSGLQGGESCCSVETVAGFQDRANGLIGKLNNYATARDLYVAQLRNSFYDRFNDIVEDINEDHNNDLQAIRQADAGVADTLQGDIDNSNQINNDAREINRQFVGAMDDYQTARTNCFNTALQVQASSWCLACDPNYATQGVAEDGAVTFSDGLCQAINDACWPFFNESARFNPLIRAREAYWRLVAVSRYLDEFSRTNQVTPFNISDDPYNPLSTQGETTVPDEWAGGDAATRQCIDLWSGDESLAELLTIGRSVPTPIEDNQNGEVPPEDPNAGNEEVPPEDPNADNIVLVVDPNTGSRLLQDVLAGDRGTWAPDLTATGLDFEDLRTDPGDFFGASDYSDYFNQTQNPTDLTDNNDDHTDHDIFDRTDDNN